MTQCNFDFSFPDNLVMSMQSYTKDGMKHVSIVFVPAKPEAPTPAGNNSPESENVT